jgi:hypothetical protein
MTPSQKIAQIKERKADKHTRLRKEPAVFAAENKLLMDQILLVFFLSKKFHSGRVPKGGQIQMSGPSDLKNANSPVFTVKFSTADLTTLLKWCMWKLRQYPAILSATTSRPRDLKKQRTENTGSFAPVALGPVLVELFNSADEKGSPFLGPNGPAPGALPLIQSLTALSQGFASQYSIAKAFEVGVAWQGIRGRIGEGKAGKNVIRLTAGMTRIFGSLPSLYGSAQNPVTKKYDMFNQTGQSTIDAIQKKPVVPSKSKKNAGQVLVARARPDFAAGGLIGLLDTKSISALNYYKPSDIAATVNSNYVVPLGQLTPDQARTKFAALISPELKAAVNADIALLEAASIVYKDSVPIKKKAAVPLTAAKKAQKAADRQRAHAVGGTVARVAVRGGGFAGGFAAPVAAPQVAAPVSFATAPANFNASAPAV